METRIQGGAMRKKVYTVYSILFSKEGEYRFTVPGLTEELKKHDVSVQQDDVQHEVDRFIRLGLVRQNLRDYSIRV